MTDISALAAPLRDLAALTRLGDGWNYGLGSAPSIIAHMNATAITLAASIAGATKFEFFPEDGGGILAIAYRGSESAEILAKSGGGFELAFESDTGLSPAENLATIKEVQAELEQRGWQSQRSSDSFTRVITASEKTVIRPWHFDPAGAVFLSSTPAALPPKGTLVAPMQNVIILDESAAPPRYSGASKPQNLLEAAG